MPSNIAVSITADETKATVALAKLSAALKVSTKDLNTLAAQAQATGAATPEMAAAMEKAASSVVTLRSQSAGLRAEITAAKSSFMDLGSAAGIAREAVGALGVTFGAAAIVEFGKSVFENAVEIQHQSEVLGLSTMAYQAFTKAGMLAGVATETVDTSLKRFNAAQGAAQEGLKAQADAFRDLGVDARLPAEEAIPAVARALESMTDNARRARDETVLFGRSGQELNPLLGQWAQGMEELTANLSAAGLLMSGDLPKQALDAKIAMDKAWGQVDVAWAQPVIEFTSDLADLIGWLDKIPAKMNAFEELMAGGREKGWLQSGSDQQHGAEGSWDAKPAYNPQPVAITGENPGILAGEKEAQEAAKKAAAQARQIADETAQAYEQGNLKHIASEEQTNSFLTQMGRQSLDTWLAQANELENERYAIALKGVQQREKADRGDPAKLAKDQAEEAQLEQEHIDKLIEIDQQWEEKKAQLNQKALQDFIKSNDDRLALETDALQREVNAGQITAAQKYAIEVALTRDIEQQDIERIRAMQVGLDQQSDAYKAYAQQIEDIQKKLDGQLTKDQQDQVNAMKKEWAPVTQGFDQMVDGILQGNMNLGQILERTFITVAEDYIKQQIAQLEQTIFTEQAKTAAVETGEQMRVAAQEAGAQEGSALSVAAGSTTIMNDAKTAASGAYAALSGIPIVGPALGAAAAGVTFAAVMAYDSLSSFDVGTPMVPRTMPAMVHQGEMIVPSTFAAGIRSGALTLGGSRGGGRGAMPPVNVHIHANDAQSFMGNIMSLRREVAGMVADAWNRNPSLRPNY